MLSIALIISVAAASPGESDLGSRARRYLGPNSEKWTEVSQSDSFVDFVDPSEVVRLGDKVEAWVLTVFIPKGKLQNGTAFGSSMSLESHDCGRRRVQALETIYYSGQSGNGKVVLSSKPEEPEWDRLVPGSVAAARHDLLCQPTERPPAPEPAPSNTVKLSTQEMWLLRAKRAVDSFAALEPQLKSSAPEAAAKAKCTALLEISYSAHIDPSMTQTVQKRSPDGDGYHLLLNGGDAGVFDLTYYYSKGSEVPFARIDSLPKGWQLLFMDAPNFVVSTGGGNGFACDFILSTADPFAAFASARRTSAPEPASQQKR